MNPSKGGPERRLLLPWRTLTFQLFALIILPLIALLLVISFASITLHQRDMRKLVGERDERAVLASAGALGDQINHRLDASRSLALRVSDRSASDLPQILSSSDYLLPDFDEGLAFVGKDGNLLTSIGNQSFWSQFSSTLPSTLKPVLGNANQPNLISDAFRDRVNNERVALVIADVPGQDWSVVGAFSIQQLIRRTLEEAFPPGSNSSILLVDSKAQVLYSNGNLENTDSTSTHPGVMQALQGKSGALYQQVGKSEHVIAYSPVNPGGWALIIEEPWELVVTPALTTTQLAPWVLVPVLLLALLALWFGLRQVVQPLQALEAKAAELSWGNYQAIEKPVGGIAEIRHLQAELVHMAQKVRAAQQSLHNYIGAITAGQEDERRRLARELHDDTLQSLIALKQRVQLAHLTMGDGSAGEAMSELESLTENTIEELRRLTRALRPIYLEDLGLVAALEMLAQENEKSIGIPIEFHRSGSERRLKPEAELALYRMTQEAVSNIARHAEAKQAAVRIAFAPEEVRLEVSDNGKGFTVPKSPAEFASSGHFGLLGLHERAELIGALLSIESAPGQGTHVKITLPVPKP